MNKGKNILKGLGVILIAFLVYALLMVAFIFKSPNIEETDISFNKDEMLSASLDTIYANIIETSKEALDVRLHMIEKATKTINISYYYIKDEFVTQYFLGALLNKANEGIEVNVIVDGLIKDYDKNFKLLRSLENINYYIYEEKSLLFPYRNNNVLHDKLVIVDNNYGLIGGRNIGDRFLNENHTTITNDRDVLVFNDLEEIDAIKQMNDYFDLLITSPFTKKVKQKKFKKADKLIDQYIKAYENYKEEMFSWDYFYNNKTKIDNATFVHGPIKRLSKYPIVAETVLGLYEEGQKMIIQSPYFTDSKLMRKYFPHNGKNKDITLITNNMSINPNFFGATSYFTQRNFLAENYSVYEIQHEESHHSKSLTIGNDISIIGSLNMDHRSFFLSTESMFVIYSEEFNSKLNDVFANIIEDSLKVLSDGTYEENEHLKPVKENKIRLFFVRFASLFAKLFEEMLTRTF